MFYRNYLETNHWSKLKEKKERKGKKRCAICGCTENVDLHHLNYKNLIDVNLSDLRFLCRRCHFLGHKLYGEGKIVFKSENHHSRFVIIKNAIKKELGLENINLFN